ncbi:MAG: ferrous iron transport protein A [Desulfovibrio sp.]|nr:ferrous iron transport protein A [Desulfovibrio sp.]
MAISRGIALTSLQKGEKAQILQITSHGELGRRIRDLGLIPGVSISLLGRAPLGDPLALRVADTTVAIRKREAQAIFIKR